MAFVIGVDEAGYGPNLGPLAITATVWELPHKLCRANLYEVLQHVVSSEVTEVTTSKLIIADSKSVYSSSRGLSVLERNVLAALASCGDLPRGWAEFHACYVDSSCERLHETPGYHYVAMNVPHVCEWDEIRQLAVRLRDGLEACKVRLRVVRSFLVFPARFNQLLTQLENKSNVLTRLTLDLVQCVLSTLPAEEPLYIYCDKHGGRNRYGPMLQQIFSEYLVEVYRESAERSVYRWGPRSRRTEIHFSANGEQFLAAALASMISKYLRELAMISFNAFWQQHLPDVRPTAGYPSDARRFKDAVQSKQVELGIADHVLWRNR